MYKVGIDKYCLTGSLQQEYPIPISLSTQATTLACLPRRYKALPELVLPDPNPLLVV